jgi:hypothetical protein
MVRFSDRLQQDVLALALDLGGMPAGLDPSTQALTIALRDDDDVFNVTIPAGTLREVRPDRFVWKDPTGSIGGIRSLRLGRRGSRAVLRLRAFAPGLSAADCADHFIEISLRAGTVAVTTTPLWHDSGRAVVAKQ